jgi:hypothetical protein
MNDDLTLLREYARLIFPQPSGGDFPSKFLEVKIVAAEAKIFNDVGDDAARHVARMPGEGNEPGGMKRIGIMPMAAGGAQQFASHLAQAALKLAAIP